VKNNRRRLYDNSNNDSARIDALKSCIPICAACKKVRDDVGCWDPLETYLSKHMDVVFTHGLCPECSERYRSEIKGASRKS
jgi:hypothetical protein